MSSSTKRRTVRYAVEEGLGSSAVACRAHGLSRSTYYRVSQISEEPGVLVFPGPAGGRRRDEEMFGAGTL